MTVPTTLNSKFWKIIFLIAGIYTAGGVFLGIINPEKGLLDFTGKVIEDWNAIYFFRSLWITVLVFGIGFFIVSRNPSKHIGIVVMGFFGKLLFALNVLTQHQNLSQMAVAAAIVDLIFVTAFGIFMFKYYKHKKENELQHDI
jgi:hypothetical protein